MAKRNKIIIVAALAAALIAALVLTLVFTLGGEDADGKAVNVETVKSTVEELKANGKIAAYYIYTESDLRKEEMRVGLDEGDVVSGIFVKNGTSALNVFEFKSDEVAQSRLEALTPTLAPNAVIKREGKTLLYGEQALIDLILGEGD